MATKTGTGFSSKIDSFLSGKEAAANAMAQIAPLLPHLVLCFCSDKHDPQQFLAGVRSQTGSAQVAGGAAFGVFTNTALSYEGYEGNVAVLSSDTISFKVLAQGGLNKNEYTAGAALADSIKAEQTGEEKGLILLYDSAKSAEPPLLNFATPLCKAISERLDPSLPIVGGGVMANLTLTNCFQFYNEKVVTQHVLAILISGECAFHDTIIHGCSPASSYKKITRAEGPMLYEIENRPAVEVVDELLGDRSINWSEYALYITFGVNRGEKFGTFKEEEYANRVCLAVDEQQKAMVMFEPDLKAGDEVQLMARSINLDYVENGIRNLKEKAAGNTPLFYFYINCGGRMKSYAGTELEDVEAVQRVIGTDVPLMGFYSGVEIAKVGGRLQPLDWTGVLCLLTEK
ncbi:hypothetical protein EPD60_16310 [Flaviaesturariibacter flavus]|uniref:Histidine kinase n=1 Tax=Flaviaesturariibacter flavus TaxID=2502780 RepID=A0A4R1B7C1_9BACT|nr:FIST N-terminal domain-containing protein [Flaviaesturariibacter flavus]TCJ12115.1 hypothetical protein EPD60_16310 [Flaviaesturariibacter flavus]